ncbi:MAG: hypothetical protein AAF317_04160 [Pseudomonadota bacterium]
MKKPDLLALVLLALVPAYVPAQTGRDVRRQQGTLTLVEEEPRLLTECARLTDEIGIMRPKKKMRRDCGLSRAYPPDRHAIGQDVARTETRMTEIAARLDVVVGAKQARMDKRDDQRGTAHPAPPRPVSSRVRSEGCARSPAIVLGIDRERGVRAASRGAARRSAQWGGRDMTSVLAGQ